MSSATIAKSRHFKRECRALKKNQDGGNDNKNKDNNFVAMISEAFSLEEEKSWCVDSEATRHVCNDLTILKTYEPLYSMLYMGNHSTAQVKRKGKIDLVFTYGNTLTLNDVLHVPDVLHPSTKVAVRWKGYHNGVKCFKLKLKRLPFPTIQRSSKTLELVHSDVCDLHATPTIGGKKYCCILCIDDYSRYCYVYLLHSKDEVLEKFRIYKSEVESKCDTRIKCLRADRGSEYYDLRYFQYTVIVHKVTAPYTPQQNGIAERKNHTLMDMVNSMIVPSKRSIKTPYELWNQRTPKLDYLRIWRCRAIVRLPESKKRKLGDKGIECIFLGYAQNSKAYRFIVVEPNDLISVNTIIESRDARFDENRKLRIDGSIEKFKARLVAKGFTQREGLDYFDTYATVARNTTIRILIALASINKLIIHQMDVKTAFLNGELEEEVYMEQPEGFVIQGQENKVCKVIKSLYGLKQALKQWHQKFNQVILSNGFRINESDKCVYSRFINGKGVIDDYIDDMLIFGTDLEQVQMTKKLLSENFDMKDLGEVDVILGIKILRKENRLMLTQSHYIEKILKRFDNFNCLPVSTLFEVGSKLTYNTARILAQNKYAKVIGSLMYAMTCTRPDIAYDVGRLSRHTSSPDKEH
ncbi:zinc finger, CCHC-type containing protein [Tanacetum coccineum]